MAKIFAAVLDAMRAHPKKMPLNDRGQLVPDPVPMAPPIGFKPQPSMVELIRDQVRRVSEEAKRDGHESFEDADDFDIGDEPELHSPYEVDLETEVPIKVLRQRAEEAQEEYLAAKREAGERMQKDAGGREAPAGENSPGSQSPPEPRPSPEGGRGPGGEPPGERSPLSKNPTTR